ncbi:alpha-amylase [Antarcticibacterium flavum]|uniref:Alpha-amylase n=1 Tax=Antarcticibacterium flavum TaxID=2058175 RepID=A0A5B7X8G4_9FLAO|nr:MULTISPECIES: alpha-amylase family glycosyl hydrolase [Antarcticibacterium]MCM4161601.1 alpha-amylase [Antarcticibacterium sp. W02-3]QCY71370.1 alpha-amylase [Antarcticibacterium flavum]
MRNYINVLFIFLGTTSLLSCQTSDDEITRGGHQEYEQYGTAFQQVPDSRDVSMYQVNIRAFSEEGTFNGVIDGLDHISDLGVNVLYLMPVYPVGEERSAGGLGSPYSVRDYYSVNPEFGTLEDLRNLVDGAHERGMAVIMDWVPNHTAWDNEWITTNPEWYQQDEEGNIIHPPGTNWQDVAQLDYSNDELRAAMKDAMSYWIYTANIDGYRVDAADYVPHSFWAETVPFLRNIKNQDMIMFAEGSRKDHFRAGFDYIFGFNFFDHLKQVFVDNASATVLQNSFATEYENVYDDTKRVVRYTSNHDVNLSDGTPQELFGGDRGSMAAFVVAAYMKSIPMIYNGQEIGWNERLEFFSRDPINWNAANNELLEEYKDIIEFRNNSTAIRRGEYNGYSSEHVAAFTMSTEDETVLVLSNQRNRENNFIFPSTLAGTSWEDIFNGGTVSLESQITLEPFQYLVLRTGN